MEQEKTTVTKDMVSESIKKELMEEGRVQAKAEFDRQQQELSDKVTAMESEKVELESRVNELSNAERNRLSDLTDEKRIAEAQLRELETKPEYRGYNLKIERSGEKVRQAAVNDSTHETSKMLMSEFLERKAEEEKIPLKQLKDELNALAVISGTKESRYPHLMPHERIRVLYSERSEKRRYLALEDENKRLKAEKDGFSEEGIRKPTDPRSNVQLREAHVSGDVNAGIELSKQLTQRQKELDTQK